MPREEDREKFKRLAEQRVTKVLKQIKLVGNLSNRSNYEYSDGDVKKILEVSPDEEPLYIMPVGKMR